MFGQSDNNQTSDQGTDFSHAVNDITAQANQPDQPTQPVDQNGPSGWGHPGQPIQDNNASAPSTDSTPPTVDASPVNNDNPSSQDEQTPPATDSTDVNALIDIKQKALGELKPLVEHLDQNNEEKFNTLMMMIQASDDEKLVQEAYAAAQKITDQKARAQALLDIVNEINYFTQQPGSPQ